MEERREARREIAKGNKRTNLGADVGEGGGGDDGEADEENIGLRVGQRAETIVVLLT